MGPSIRVATMDDVPAMAALLAELFAIEADFRSEPVKQAAGLVRLMQASSARAWVAEAQGCVVGMITLQVLVSTAEGGDVGLIEDLVVTAPWRRRGLGHRLIAAAEEWAWEQGLRRLQLLADRENLPALNFYRTQGWTSTSLVALRKFK